MNGIVKSALVVAITAGSIGCGGEHYRNLVDPCHYERYGSVARQEEISCFTPQVLNGRILDQTLFNYHFEKGSEELHPMGIKKLSELLQRRPQPDFRIFVATAHDNDLKYETKKMESFGEARRDLDARRVAAVQKFLAEATLGRPMNFEVVIHDPAEPYLHAIPGIMAIQRNQMSYSGSLNGGQGGGGQGGQQGQQGGQQGGGGYGGGTGGAVGGQGSLGTGQGGSGSGMNR